MCSTSLKATAADTAPVELLTKKIEQLQTILDHVGAYVFTKDWQGKYTFANKMVCDLFGKPLEKILGRTDEDFFDLSVSNQLRVNDRRVLDYGELIEREETNVMVATGETRIYWSVKMPLRDVSGVIHGMCGISTDITDRLKLESKVVEQKQLLDTILNNIDSHVYMKDRQRRYLFVNQHTASLFGYPQEKIVGRCDSELMPEEDAARFAEMDRKVFERGEKICGEETFTDANDILRHYWSIKVPLFKEGKVNSYVGISTDITDIITLKEQFRHLAHTDSLTTIANRRHLLDEVELELKRNRRRGGSFAVLMFDIDRFKEVNDIYGHATGDRTLIAVADICKRNLRAVDLLGRYGGDEFVAVLPETNLVSALVVAERIRQAVYRTEVDCDQGAMITVSISIGLTIATPESTLDILLGKADAALYGAKRHGRNCVWHAGLDGE